MVGADGECGAELQPLATCIRASVAPTRFYTILASVFAVIAVTLGAIGIYGLLTDAVIRRRRELGIRVALGASARTVVGNVVGDAVRLAAFGVGIGLLASVGAGRWLRALLVDIGERDPIALGGAAAVFALVALSAARWPRQSGRCASIRSKPFGLTEHRADLLVRYPS